MRAWWWLALAGCAGEVGPQPGDPGSVYVCLMRDSLSDPSGDEAGLDVWRIAGDVVAVDGFEGPLPASAGRSCQPSTDGAFVELEDEDGTRWRAGWYVVGSRGDATPAPPVEVGDPVDVVFAIDPTLSGDQALALSVDGVPVLLAEEGMGVRLDALDGEVMGGLGIGRGSASGRFFRDDCGQIVEDRLAVTPPGTGETVEIATFVPYRATGGARDLEVVSAGAWHYLAPEGACAEQPEPLPWYAVAVGE